MARASVYDAGGCAHARPGAGRACALTHAPVSQPTPFLRPPPQLPATVATIRIAAEFADDAALARGDNETLVDALAAALGATDHTLRGRSVRARARARARPNVCADHPCGDTLAFVRIMPQSSGEVVFIKDLCGSVSGLLAAEDSQAAGDAKPTGALKLYSFIDNLVHATIQKNGDGNCPLWVI